MESFNIEKQEGENKYLKILLETTDNLLKNPKYKEQTRENIRKQIEDLYDKKEKLITILLKQVKSSAERQKYLRKLADHERKLINKYSKEKCLECLAWHILIGSTPLKDYINFLDFEGKDSIAKFINEFYEEMIRKGQEENN